jgi:hypothetical protein
LRTVPADLALDAGDTPAQPLRVASADEQEGVRPRGRPGRSEAVLSLAGSLVIASGFGLLAYEAYLFEIPAPVPTFCCFMPYEYGLGGNIFLALGVLVFGTGWTPGQRRRAGVPRPRSVFERYRPRWGIGVGVSGCILVIAGLVIESLFFASLLTGLPGLADFGEYGLSAGYFTIATGLALWAVGAFLSSGRT